MVGKRCENYNCLENPLPIYFMRLDLNEHSRFRKIEQLCLMSSILLLICAGVMSFVMMSQFKDRFYPGVNIDSLSVTGKTKAEVKQELLASENDRPTFSLTLRVDDIEVASSAAELGGHYDYDAAIEQAYSIGREASFFSRVWRVISPWSKAENVESAYRVDDELVKQQLAHLAAKVDVPAEQPSAVLKLSGVATSLKISPGTTGRVVNQAETLAKVHERITPTDIHIPVIVASVSAGLAPEQIEPALERAKKLVGKKVTLRADNVFREMNDQLLVNVLAFPTGLSDERLQPVIEELAKEVNRAPQNPIFEYDPETLKVTKFEPPRKGLGLNPEVFTQQLSEAIQTFETTDQKDVEVALRVDETQPSKALADTNQLGIAERIGFGESQYEHSIPNRVANVSLTTTRINNTIVKPGEEFSFNKALGDVSAATGFKSAYIIQNGRTVLGDGGGVCQVSTTLFRALLDAGVQITKRKPHSYRVSYYEQNSKPGIDATVFSGDVDLRFINDTGQHILIHTEADSSKLYMTVELYGTSDGRTTEIVDHKTWDARPAPAPLYIDDPTIPAGQVKQIDFATSGIRASFRNVVKDKDGNIIREDTYNSNYVPWQAVFLRGV